MTERREDGAPGASGAHSLVSVSILGVVAVAAVAIALVVAFRDTADPVVVGGRADAKPPVRQRAARPPARPFSPTSFWNRPLARNVPVHSSSAALVAELDSEVGREAQAGFGPWISGVFTTTLYRVGPAQPLVRVRLDPTSTPGASALRRALARVPVPGGARPAAGPDRHMTIWQPSTDRLWELFRAHRLADGWHARWGGAIRHVSRSPGYYTRSAWPGATTTWGATASSLPVLGGTIMAGELRSGRIDHAMALNLPAPRAGVFAWPAQRTDGTGPPSALPEGARLRLDPAVDVDGLRLPKLVRMIAQAAQRYGFVVRDQTLHGVTLFVQNPAQVRGNPYSDLYRGRTPAELLARFPWDRLQVLRMSLCTHAPCRRSG